MVDIKEGNDFLSLPASLKDFHIPKVLFKLMMYSTDVVWTEETRQGSASGRVWCLGSYTRCMKDVRPYSLVEKAFVAYTLINRFSRVWEPKHSLYRERKTITEVYLGIGILCVTFICLALAINSGRRHARAMRQFSETIGFSYMPHVEDDEAFLQRFSRLSLFCRNKTTIRGPL